MGEKKLINLYTRNVINKIVKIIEKLAYLARIINYPVKV